MSTYFASVNRNKHSVTLDLTDEVDVALARELCRRADVVIENFLVGRLTAFGLDAASVLRVQPGRGLLLDLGLRQRCRGGPARVRLRGAGRRRAHEPHRIARRATDQGRCGDRRCVDRPARRRRHPRGAAGARPYGRRPARRGQPALQPARLARQPGIRLSQRRRRAEPPGQPAPEHRPYETVEAADAPLAVAVGNDGQFARLCTRDRTCRTC